MGKLKDQLAGIAALVAAIVAIGGGFIKYGEITTKLDNLSNQSPEQAEEVAENSIGRILFFSLAIFFALSVTTPAWHFKRSSATHEISLRFFIFTTISLQTAVKRKDQIKCLIGYSGKILNLNHLSKNVLSRPDIYLMHGDKDQVVPVNHILEAKEFFLKHNYEISTKIFNASSIKKSRYNNEII